ncbi:hypothetical protein [Elizabethkingia phage TCUEAP2]|nr:hypothetical protein [Elizabethkingia phage TCUEAP2]
MIKFLLFVSIANLFISIFIAPPKSKEGNLYFTNYTNASFKATLFFWFLALIV